MFTAFLYKEWIKLRTPLIILFTLQLLWLLRLGFFLNANRSDNNIMMWFDWMWGGKLFFSGFSPLPAIIAFVIALAQFLPETRDKRLKLMLHLPLSQYRVIASHLLIGLAALFTLCLIAACIITSYIYLWFPAFLILPALLSILPWCLAGVCIYSLTAMAVMEGKVLYRITYSSIIAGLFLWFTRADYHLWYGSALPWLAVVTLFTLPLPLLSVQRFRQGVSA
ncbi:MAG: hypothetical protein QF552_08340 [Litorilituus sp.]|jgi:hypothetical protein|nr:hypothetical protein [Litorilituus sp.]